VDLFAGVVRRPALLTSGEPIERHDERACLTTRNGLERAAAAIKATLLPQDNNNLELALFVGMRAYYCERIHLDSEIMMNGAEEMNELGRRSAGSNSI
jgi:hypothetical protein